MRQDSVDSRMTTSRGQYKRAAQGEVSSTEERVNYLHDIEPHLKSGEGLFQDLDISMVFASAVVKLRLVPK